MKKTTALLIVGVASVIGVAFSNCSAFQAEQGGSSSGSSLLGGLGDVSVLRESDAQVYIPPALTFGPAFSADVTATCSDIGSATLNGNVVRAKTSIALVITPKSGGTACTYSDETIRDNIMGFKKLVIPPPKQICPNFTSGDYTVQLIGNGSSANLLAGAADPLAIRMGGAPAYEVSITTDQYNNLTWVPAASMTGIKASVLMGANTLGSDITVTSGANGFDELCDQRASPLLVQIHPGSSFINKIELSSQAQGVSFDIKGKNDTTPDQKRLISWFTPATINGNFFIVLPDANGNVTGIDQMFGDNTTGPDGQLAANGYEALRKWDGRRDDGSYDQSARDGVITNKDPVFSKLRLWQDSNLDGVAQPYELYTLDAYDVVQIDLNYDKNFGESDVYGNQVKLKSVVHTKDGLVHVMYDIWFKYF
jgi:hypothetical protein